MDANAVLPLILGAGGVAFLTTIFTFVKDWRNSAETRESRAIGNLERWGTQAQQDLQFERDVSAYWRRRSAVLEHLLLRHGIDCPPPEKPPHPTHTPSPKV